MALDPIIYSIIMGFLLGFLLVYGINYYITQKNIIVKGPNSNEVKKQIHYKTDTEGTISCYYFKPKVYICGINCSK
jgi:hypothetical protein